MAEKKKVTNTKEEVAKKKTTTKKTTKKTAVSSKKDTAKVVSAKKTETKKETKNTSAKKASTKKPTNKKDEALKALDEEVLAKETTGKKVKAKEEPVKKETSKPQEERKSVLDDLIGKPKTPEEEALEDKGVFSSKVVGYLFFLLLIIVICFCYVYYGDKNKNINNQIAKQTTNTKNEVDFSANKLPAFNESEAKDTIASYFGIKKYIDSDPTRFLADCGLTKVENLGRFSKTKDGKYYLTDVQYDNLRRSVEHIISRSCFETAFASSVKLKNNLAITRIERLPIISYKVEEVSYTVDTNPPEVKARYTETTEDGKTTEKTATFVFKAQNGKWIIDGIK